jgi:2,6-dihydroxypyridine 3-monooxygenase
MVMGRVCLVGDAAITARPHGGAGGAKAAADAWALADALLASDGDVAAALRRWEPARLQQGHAYLAKVRHMGRMLQSGGVVAPRDPALRWGLTPDPEARETLQTT